jgi:hypothetical protein
MTANLGKVLTILDLASLTNAAYQASFTVKNITGAFPKPNIWPFSRHAFSDVDFDPSFVTPMEKELRNQEITVPSTSTPVAREISGTGKDSLSPEDVCPFPKPGHKGGRLSLTF